MKRYIIVKEFFGVRVYDSVCKVEQYFDNSNSEKICKLLNGNASYINNCRRDGNLSAPLKISMNITKKCNLRCEQCFSESGEIGGNELSTLELYKLFDDMREFGTFFICIGGGEPLMRDDILDILRYGYNKQLAISIVSNGILFTRELIEAMNECHLDTIWISLEGLEENHDRLRGKGTFVKALEAILLLKKYSNAKIAIRMSLSRFNIDEYHDVIQIAENYNVDILRFTPLLEYGRALGKNLTISQQQYVDFLNEISQVKSKVNIIHPNIVDKDKFWITPNNFGCHCGKEAVWIDETGGYSPCFFFGESYFVGNIRECSYHSLWEKSLSATTFTGNSVCRTCANYSVCRGGCRARALMAYGNINAVDPLCPLRKNVSST